MWCVYSPEICECGEYCAQFVFARRTSFRRCWRVLTRLSCYKECKQLKGCCIDVYSFGTDHYRNTRMGWNYETNDLNKRYFYCSEVEVFSFAPFLWTLALSRWSPMKCAHCLQIEHNNNYSMLQTIDVDV